MPHATGLSFCSLEKCKVIHMSGQEGERTTHTHEIGTRFKKIGIIAQQVVHCGGPTKVYCPHDNALTLYEQAVQGKSVNDFVRGSKLVKCNTHSLGSLWH